MNFHVNRACLKYRVTFGPSRVSLPIMNRKHRRVSLRDNPANASTSALVRKSMRKSGSFRVINLLGQTVQKADAVAIQSNGTGIPLNVSQWPSGNYIIEAIGDEGSHARTMLSVQH